MSKLLLKLPWFAAAPLVLLIAGVFAWLGYAFTGDYFNETCMNERNLLTNEFEPSNCGEGAKVAARLKAQGDAGPAAGSTAPVTGASPVAGASATPVRSGTPTRGVLAQGTFRDGDAAHSGAGQVEIQRLPSGKLNVFLSNFSVTNGPDLFVVLGRSAGGSYGKDDFTVAKLKANNGNQNYEIEGEVNLADYRSVVIWCRRFNIVFAYAPLKDGQATAPSSGLPVVAAAGDPPSSPTAAPTAAATATPTVISPTTGPNPANTPTPVPATATATATATVPPRPTLAAGPLLRGAFRDGAPGHTGSGAAEVQRLADGSLNLFLSGFSVTNGPDLFVVLSTGDGGSYSGADLTLAKLRANNGNQNYSIPAGTDPSSYRTVLIWCRQFDTVFAYATLGGV